MSRAIDALRLVGAALGGVGICLFIVGKVGAASPVVPAHERTNRPDQASSPAEAASPLHIAPPSSPRMAELRAEGLARIESVAERGVLERRDARALRQIYRRLDTGGRKAMRVVFHAEFNDGRIVVDDPTLFPF